MMRVKYLIKSLVFLVSFIFIFSLVANTSCGQTLEKKNSKDHKTAEYMAEKLQQKILLTETQKKTISKILFTYISSLKKDKLETGDHKDINLKIEGLLDKRQKIKFSIIKANWWKCFKMD